MIVYRYRYCNRIYDLRFNALTHAALKQATDDINDCQGKCPIGIYNIQGIEIYSQAAIFKAYMQPFICEMRQVQQQTRQGALLHVSVPNIGR